MFSVIIPTYNRADKLKKCLDSLLNQTYKNFEVIVCDDGSTDNTADVIKEFDKNELKLIYNFNVNSGGPAHPRNIGVGLASYDWVCFLDSDDWWYNEKLNKTLEYCEQGFDLIYHDFDLYKNGNKTQKKHKGRQLEKPIFNDLFIKDNCIVNSSVCLKKELLINAGKFDEDKELVAVEDYDLWLKCSKLTDRFKYIPDVLGGYNISDDSISNVNLINRFDKLFNKHKSGLNNYQIELARINWNYKRGVVFEKNHQLKNAKASYLIACKSNLKQLRFKAIVRFIALSIKTFFK